MWLSFTGTCQKPLIASIVVKKAAPWRAARVSSIRGIGIASDLVTRFTPR